MTRTRSNLARTTGTPRSLLKMTVAAALAAAALWAPVAQAGMVTFENLDPTAYLVGDTFSSGHVNFMSVDTEGAAAPGSSLSGAIFDSTDAGSCWIDCPVSNGGKYFAGLANGALIAEAEHAATGAKLMLKGFDASFIGNHPGSAYPTIPGYLRVMGFFGANYMMRTYALDPKGQNGFELSTYITDDLFANTSFDSLAIFAFGCSGAASASCSPYGNNYDAQFALDNLNLTTVPEPATAMTLMLGLAGLAAARRRRSK